MYENKSKYSQDVRPPTFENHFENVCQTTPVVRSSEVNGKLRKKFYSQKSSKTLDICKRVLEKESPGKRKFSEFNETQTQDSQNFSRKIPKIDDKRKFLARFGMDPGKGGPAKKSADQF